MGSQSHLPEVCIEDLHWPEQILILMSFRATAELLSCLLTVILLYTQKELFKEKYSLSLTIRIDYTVTSFSVNDYRCDGLIITFNLP